MNGRMELPEVSKRKVKAAPPAPYPQEGQMLREPEQINWNCSKTPNLPTEPNNKLQTKTSTSDYHLTCIKTFEALHKDAQSPYSA